MKGNLIQMQNNSNKLLIKRIHLSVVLSSIILSFGACSTTSLTAESKVISQYIKTREVNSTTTTIAATNTAKAMIVKNNPKTIKDVLKKISKHNNKPIVLDSTIIAITDDIEFLNYQDVKDYIQAKNLPYNMIISNYPRFDRIEFKPIDKTASTLKNTKISISGSLNNYDEVQNLAKSLNIPLSSDSYSVKQLAINNIISFGGNAYDYLESIAEQNNIFFNIEDGKIVFRQFNEQLFAITITPLSIETKTIQSMTASNGGASGGASGGSSGATSTASTSTSGGSQGSSSTTANQSISYEIYKELDQTIKNIIGEGGGSYHLNQASGQLFARSKRVSMGMIKKVVDNFNEMYSKIIEINMTIVEVTLNDKFEAGINIGVLADNLTTDLKGGVLSTMGSTLTISGITKINNGLNKTFNLSSAIAALKQFGDTKVTSKTSSLTINSIPTYGVSFFEKDYISELSQSQGATTTDNSASTWSTTKSTAVDGLSFHLFPRINPNGKVVLSVELKLAKHLGLEPFSPVTGSYIQNETRNQKDFTNTIIIDDGGTSILAGISSDEEKTDKQGLPFIGKNDSFLDFLGGSRAKSKAHSELVIFISTNIRN